MVTVSYKGEKDNESLGISVVLGFWGNTVVWLVIYIILSAGANLGSLRSFIWKILIPLVKLIHAYDREILNKVNG